MTGYANGIVAMSVLLLLGCGNPINMKTASNYAQAAQH